ncbi:MAG TPA: LacI family DNA-binding transcriptional regulator [Chthoniobacteraceae bacterium]|nr:LacI family DNA-binding transcriptional regulator [Chthoniobacteraceae bacterium]
MKTVLKTVTQADIARALGISQTTVGLVVGQSTSARGKEKLKPETIQRIEAKAREMGYRPDRHAQIMRRGKTTLIGMIYSGVALQVANERAFCVNQAIKERGYEMVPFDVRWTGGQHTEALEYMMDIKAAGMLLSASYIDPEEFDRLQQVKTPMVGLSAFEMEGMPLVRSNMRDGMRQVADHLLAEGHRRLVQLSYSSRPEVPLANWVWQQRQQAAGFREGLLAAGGRHQVCSLAGYAQWLRESANDPGPCGITLCITGKIKQEASVWNPYHFGAAFARELLKAAELPDAVICPNDDWAFGFANEAVRTGLSVPQQLAITGYNASALAEAFHVPLTTVTQPTSEMSKLAVSLLIDRIEGKPPDCGTYDLPGELIVRASSLRLRAF